MADLDSIFQHWLETGEISKQDRLRLEQDDIYAELLANSEQWQQLSQEYQETPVPNWDREATWFAKSKSKSWLGNINTWFAPAALACSILMCSLVLMRAEITVDEKGVSLAFQKAQTEQPVTYEQLQALLASHQQSSADATFALVKEAIDQGRLERKEDIGALVSHLNDIRKQDQALIRLQLNELAEQVENQPQSSIAKN